MSHWVNGVTVTSDLSVLEHLCESPLHHITLLHLKAQYQMYSFDSNCKRTQNSVPQTCSSHVLTHVSWGADMLHVACCMLQSIPLSLFAEHHMENGGIG